MSLKTRLKYLEAKRPKHKTPPMIIILLESDSEAIKLAKRKEGVKRGQTLMLLPVILTTNKSITYKFNI